MKKIMILGAGIYQVPLIKAARDMGLYTIVVSIQGNYPGFQYGDKVYYEDTTDYEKIIEIAREESIDGIVTTGTDVAVITIGKVCDALGLCGLSSEAAAIASNKELMKEAYERYSVRSARFRKVPFDKNQVVDSVKDLRFPLIFKAVDTSGSRGIIKVEIEDEIGKAIEYVKIATKLDYFIVEEFISGTEFGAQAFVLGGKIQFIIPHGDYVFQGNTGVPIGHFAPYDLEEVVVADIKTQLTNAVEAMKLDNCAINADFILSDGKVYVLEIGGRAGATCLVELVSIYYGFDYYKKIVQVSLGERPCFESSKRMPNASHLILSDRDGIVRKQEYDIDDNNVLEVHFDYSCGDYVRKFQVGPDRIGHIITKGDTLIEAESSLEKAMNNIALVIE